MFYSVFLNNRCQIKVQFFSKNIYLCKKAHNFYFLFVCYKMKIITSATELKTLCLEQEQHEQFVLALISMIQHKQFTPLLLLLLLWRRLRHFECEHFFWTCQITHCHVISYSTAMISQQQKYYFKQPKTGEMKPWKIIHK